MSAYMRHFLLHLTTSGLLALAATTTTIDTVAVELEKSASASPPLRERRQVQVLLPPQPPRRKMRRKLPDHARRRQLDSKATSHDLDNQSSSSSSTVRVNSTSQTILPADALPKLSPRRLEESDGYENTAGGSISGTDFTTISIQPRIINGLPTSPNRYPYVASLLETSEMKHMCGGTLIAPDMILTAGHCSGYFDSIQVGKYDIINQQVGTFDHLVVEKNIRHPGFGNVIMNDFALAKLYGTSSVQPVRINNRRNLPAVGESLSVVGWGVTVEGDADTASEVLLGVNVSAISNDECNNSTGIYNGEFVSLAGYIVENMLCAYSPDHDACQGDSGGPLIHFDNSSQQDVQVGIVSWGLGCASSFPGVYSRISSEYSWIRETVCANAMSPPSYFVCDGGVVSTSGWAMATAEVTIAIELDGAPEDTSYVLEEDPESVIANGRTALIDGVSYVPFDTFRASLSTVSRTMFVAPNKKYRLTLLDRGMNGIQPQSGQNRQSRFRMCHGNISGDDCINAGIDSGVVICRGTGDFGLSRSIYCFVEQVGSLAPSTSPSIMKNPPTYAPLVLPIWDDDRLPTASPSLVPTSAEPMLHGTMAPTKVVPTSFLSGTSMQTLTGPGQSGAKSDEVVKVNQTNVMGNSTDVGVKQIGVKQPVNTSLETTVSSSSGRVFVASMVGLTISTVYFAII